MRLLWPIMSVMLGAVPALSADAAQAATPAALSATTLSGGQFDLAENKGRVVLVNFWATWCAPCRAEMPALDTYYRQHHASGLEMLAISVDDGARAAKLLAVTSGFAFPVARIADTRLPRSAIPSALPTTRIYGRDGRLRYETPRGGSPTLDAAALDRIVGPLLAEPAP